MEKLRENSNDLFVFSNSKQKSFSMESNKNKKSEQANFHVNENLNGVFELSSNGYFIFLMRLKKGSLKQ